MAIAIQWRWVRLRSVAVASLAHRNDRGPRMGKERAVVDDLPSAFEIVDYDYGDAPGVTVRGELDIAAVARLELALDAAIRESAGALVLDMCDLESLDSSGLRVVLRARASLARNERHLAIVCPPGPVRRLIEVAGVADLFFLYDSRAEVNAALVPSA
jgi:anti-sigma B factor antagonist